MSFPPHPHPLSPTHPNSADAADPAPPLVGPTGADVSHGEGDEAVVSLDVPLEDLRAGPQHSLEAGPVQLHALERTAGDDGCRPGAVQQEGDLTWRRKERRQSVDYLQKNVVVCDRVRM